MSVHIYNSLTRRKEPLEPLKPPRLNIYTCGVTVYDQCHIGHARSLYIFDVMRRYLKYRGFKVRFVRNITDIDDKIINKARELNTSWKSVTKRFIDSYTEDLKLLGIERGDSEPRATENIKDMIKHIRALIDKGYAYRGGADVYFNVRKFPQYGKLSNQSIEQMQAGTRIELSEAKKDPLDFTLWKKSKENEPGWMSPWGKGRPGWHIECSVMSMKYLKSKTLDIHAGGMDLIFPHHENEIAQSEALTGEPFAKYWIHHGLLTINGQKMAKSLGNFVTLKDFINKYRHADLLKLFFLNSHYSQPVDYNDQSIEAAKQAMERISILIRKAEKKDTREGKSREYKKIEELKTKFIEAMDDDFNTPEALASIFDLVTLTNNNIEDSNFLHNSRKTLRELLGIFGISFRTVLEFMEKLTIEEKTLIEKREKARKEKNYDLSDKIRKELEEKGVILEDTKDGKTIWRRKI